MTQTAETSPCGTGLFSEVLRQDLCGKPSTLNPMNLLILIGHRGASVVRTPRKLHAPGWGLILGMLLVLATSPAAFAQGLISFANTISTKISTNGFPSGGGVAVTGTGANAFYYALLTAPSTVTTVDASLQQLLTSTWTFTGLYATNTRLGGRLAGGSGVPANGWAPAQTNSYIIVGWSAHMGTTWSNVAALLNGAVCFRAGDSWDWGGGGFTMGDDWLGASPVAFGQAGGVDPVTGNSLYPWSLFGVAATAAGTPVVTGFNLYTWVPEPSTGSFMLLGLLVVAFRRFRRGSGQTRTFGHCPVARLGHRDIPL